MSAATGNATWPAPSLRIDAATLSPGESGRVVVTLDVPEGCHIQSHAPSEPFLIPTTLQLDETPGLAFGPADYPEGHTDVFEWSSVVLVVYRGVVEITVPVEVQSDAAPGARTISGRLRYQGCTDTACLPPVEQPVEAHIEVIPPK